MSMSQEEIEALMNGLDIAEDDSSTEESPADNETVNTEEIEELISQTDEVKAEEPTVEETPIEAAEPVVSAPVSETVSNDDIDALINEAGTSETVSNDDIDALINETTADVTSEPINETVSNDDIDALINETSTETVDNDDIDDLLKNLETDSDISVEDAEDISIDNFDDILADVDGIVESSSTVEDTDPSMSHPITENDKEEIVRDWTDSKINEGIIPLPAEKDTKVVNQLSQVANDSEEKVSQIFDVLSLGLDNNNEFRAKIDEVNSFLTLQTKLLTSLNAKFPNIGVFEEHLAQANNVTTNLESLKSLMNEEDMKIFEAMELMQFNDINRQKIERVMAVIRKLSLYLNNLFEDEGDHKDVAVAKHIHGDNTHDLIGDDLDKLIEEFGKN